MKPVAVAIICKTPAPGKSKTRLSPPLRAEECAAISACFIADLANTIQSLYDDGGILPAAVYTPVGTEADLCRLLPPGFQLVPQGEGDLGARLFKGISDLLDAGASGAILINSDSPTLPASILRCAVHAVRANDSLVLSRAFDGGYTLVGLSRPHRRIFEDIPWSTEAVYDLTLDRAREIGLHVVNVPGWYDVDDAASYAVLEDELLRATPPPFANVGCEGAKAFETYRFIRDRQTVTPKA